MSGVIIHKTQIDKETGEILKDSRFDLIYWDEEKGYLFWNKKSSVKIFDDIELPKGLNKTEIANMYLLSRKMYHNTNMLAFRSNGALKPMGIKEISKAIGLKERQATAFINKMRKLGILAKATIEIASKKETHYYINPIYFFNCKWLPLNLYLLFKDDLDKYIPENIKARFLEIASDSNTPIVIYKKELV